MRLALLQPQFAPNLYDLASILKADRVVFNDMEQWSRKGRTHRAAIKGEQGLQWINIQIKTADRKKAIGEVRIEQSKNWIEPFWHALYHNYSDATYFDLFIPELEHDVNKAMEFERLIDFNLYFFGRMMTYMELDVSFELASAIPDFETNPNAFKEKAGADILYQEQDAKNYQWLSDTSVSALQKNPKYKQVGDVFLPGCSLLDLLLNYGKESFQVIREIT